MSKTAIEGSPSGFCPKCGFPMDDHSWFVNGKPRERPLCPR